MHSSDARPMFRGFRVGGSGPASIRIRLSEILLHLFASLPLIRQGGASMRAPVHLTSFSFPMSNDSKTRFVLIRNVMNYSATSRGAGVRRNRDPIL